MEKDFLNWYDEKCKNIQFRNNVILNLIGDRQKGVVYDDGNKFHFKTPHSRIFKVAGYKGHMLPAGKRICSTMDNFFAISSELISRKKYRAFGMLYADYHVLLDSSLEHETKIASPNVFDNDKYYVELNHLYDQAEMFRDSAIYDTWKYNFEEVFTKKSDFLIFMTEKGYDEYVKYLLLSMFEFSDDEHYSNLIFYGDDFRDKLDGVFLFDKESTIFNPMLAANCSLDYIERSLKFNKKYNNRRCFESQEETFDRRFEMLLDMIQRGVIPPKYVRFIEEIAGIDYGAIAKSIKNESGISVNNLQIEMYQLGNRKAEELLQKI